MTKRTPIYGLDIVRFLAATLVLMLHLGFTAFGGSAKSSAWFGLPTMLPPWWPISWIGWIGVQIFFVISGLVIAYSAANARPVAYMVGRISRLLPSMLIAATFAAVIDVLVYREGVTHTGYLWLKSVTFFPIGPWISDQIWTLPIEIFFYAMVGVLIAAGKVARLGQLAWSLGILSALYWVEYSIFKFDPFLRTTQLLGFQHGCYFALGIAMSAMSRDGRNRSRFALIALCMVTASIQIWQTALVQGAAHDLHVYWPVAYLVFATAIGLIGVSLYFREEIAKRTSLRLASFIRTAGLVTYPLYLVHMHVAGPVMLALNGSGMPILFMLFIAAAASFLVALGIVTCLEPRLHSLVKRSLQSLADRFTGPRHVAARA